ncbi:MAG: hypothetical protein WCH21_05345 [Bacteroidota bacterium]
MNEQKYNEGIDVFGYPFKIELRDAELRHVWTRGKETLYYIIEPDKVYYFCQVDDLGNGEILVDVTLRTPCKTKLKVKDYLKRYHSLNII